MVVVIIIGLLAAVIVPKVISKVDEARVAKAKEDIQSLETALTMFRLDNSKYPTTDQGLTRSPAADRSHDQELEAPAAISSTSARIPGATTISTSTPARTARNTTCAPWAPTASPAAKASMPTSATGTSTINPREAAGGGAGPCRRRVYPDRDAGRRGDHRRGGRRDPALASPSPAATATCERESDRLLTLINYAREQAELQTREYGMLFQDDGYEFLVYDAQLGLWRDVAEDDALRAAQAPRRARREAAGRRATSSRTRC